MLSSRAGKFAATGFMHGEISRYDPETNPKGYVDFAQAQNWLIHEEVLEYVNKHNTFDLLNLNYNEGYTGNTRLRRAMASHLNAHFNPFQPVQADDLTFGAGVTYLNEACAFMFCDHGKRDAILLGAPIYGSFTADLALRTGIELVHADFEGIDQFHMHVIEAYERAYLEAQAQGIHIKALLICNPHNPLGQCYTKLSLERILYLCAEKGIHLISDEIYAHSVYEPMDNRRRETFTSVLSLDIPSFIDKNYVHVLYGMSKDFGAAGMRLGCIMSWNEELKKGIRAMCRFSSPSEFSQTLATRILEDQKFVNSLLATSRQRLAESRRFAEKLLDHSGIEYHRRGNAGVFLWLDLSPFLPTSETDGNPWEAEELLSRRFTSVNLGMGKGEGFVSKEPGRFRLIFAVPPEDLIEGVRRIRSVIRDDRKVDVKSIALTYQLL